jgi:hypothetical protein
MKLVLGMVAFIAGGLVLTDTFQLDMEVVGFLITFVIFGGVVVVSTVKGK